MGKGNVPKREITVVVVDDGWNATVRVVLRVLRRFLFAFLKVEVYGLVGEPKLLEYDCDLPRGCALISTRCE